MRKEKRNWALAWGATGFLMVGTVVAIFVFGRKKEQARTVLQEIYE